MMSIDESHFSLKAVKFVFFLLLFFIFIQEVQAKCYFNCSKEDKLRDRVEDAINCHWEGGGPWGGYKSKKITVNLSKNGEYILASGVSYMKSTQSSSIIEPRMPENITVHFEGRFEILIESYQLKKLVFTKIEGFEKNMTEPIDKSCLD